jgi:dihydroorotase
MERLVIRGARVVDPAQGRDGVADIQIEDGKIAGVGGPFPARDGEVLEARGLVAAPGFIDMHVHLREPGFEYKETVATGTAAAAAGGFTAVASMANTSPVNDCPSVTEYILEKARAAGKARVHPIGAATRGMEGRELAEIGEMVAAGAVAISDDGRPVSDPNVMRRAMEYARGFGIALIEHCETPELHPGGVMNEGHRSTALGLRGIPRASEMIAVDRGIRLSELTGARFHVAHLSTSGALASVRAAKARGMPVTCEVSPHHLLLTDERVGEYDTQAKMKPPLTTEEDRLALVEGLEDGAVDAIATDHAPHHQDEKDLDFDSAPFGIVGLETAVALLLDRLVRPGHLSLTRMIELLSPGPARILNVEGGTLTPGARADVTLLDLERPLLVEPRSFLSKGRNTPFTGWELRGRAVRTIVGGVTVWSLRET